MKAPSDNFQNLYVHLPFCETKCHYCDFFSLPVNKTSDQRKRDVYAAIVDELETYRAYLQEPLQTVFFGGGTPSLVPSEFLEAILKSVSLAPDAEITLESNPSSVDAEKASRWKKLGINRVSLGVQSLNDARLQWLGRAHDTKAAQVALRALHEQSFERISIDYLLGVPGQSEQDIITEMSQVLDEFPNIGHVSAYLLTLKNGNPKASSLPSESTQLEHLRTATHVLTSRGFSHYEISNFAKQGLEARHNQNYWTDAGYLGIGPSAHSYWSKQRRRTKNVANLDLYEQAVRLGKTILCEEEFLTADQLSLEFLLLRMRTSKGLKLSDFQAQARRPLPQESVLFLRSLSNAGLCGVTPNWENPDRIFLTSEGFYISDYVVAKLAQHQPNF